jgi:hypothetical protein
MVYTLQLPNPDKILKSNEHLADIIEREDIALSEGIAMFVSEYDEDLSHIQGHTASREQFEQQGISTQAIDKHIADHEAQLEQKNVGLGNTKEFGGNAGQIISPTSAAKPGS